MTEFALLIDGVFQERRQYDERPVNIPHKSVTWHPVVYETGDDFDGLVDDAWVIRRPDPAARLRTADEIRAERNRLLLESDWTQLLDAPVDRAAWATYRRSLRDLPEQDGFPLSVTWPQTP